MSTTPNAARKKRRKNRRRGKKLLVFFLIMALIATVFYALSVTVLFKIKNFEIGGSSQYTKQEIMTNSSIVIGDNLVLMSPKRVSEQLSKALPYLGEVKVERKFPNTVKITVAECKPDTVYEYDKGYIIACGEKTLEKVETKPEGLVTVKVKLDTFSIGSPIELADGTKEALAELKDAVSKSKLDGITHIDVRSISDLTVICDNKLRLRIGTTESLEKKMNNAVSIIKTQRQKFGENVEGTIDLRYLSDESNTSYFTRESIWENPQEPTPTEPTSSQISSELSSDVNSQ